MASPRSWGWGAKINPLPYLPSLSFASPLLLVPFSMDRPLSHGKKLIGSSRISWRSFGTDDATSNVKWYGGKVRTLMWRSLGYWVRGVYRPLLRNAISLVNRLPADPLPKSQMRPSLRERPLLAFCWRHQHSVSTIRIAYLIQSLETLKLITRLLLGVAYAYRATRSALRPLTFAFRLASSFRNSGRRQEP